MIVPSAPSANVLLDGSQEGLFPRGQAGLVKELGVLRTIVVNSRLIRPAGYLIVPWSGCRSLILRDFETEPVRANQKFSSTVVVRRFTLAENGPTGGQ
jgi:hypothetical protein